MARTSAAVQKATLAALSVMRTSGMTQEAIANTVGVKQATVSRWENGKATPPYVPSSLVPYVPGDLLKGVAAQQTSSVSLDLEDRVAAIEEQLGRIEALLHEIKGG